MPWDGSGNFQLPVTTVTPAVASTTIDDADFNTFTADLQTAISLCLTEDGQNAPTGNLPMGTNRHTGVGDAAALTDYASANQVVDNALHFGGTSAVGTDAYAVNLPISPGSYTTGARYQFIADVANTGACSINFNSIGVKAIKEQDGSDPADNMIVAGSMVDVQYDGTNFVLMSVDVSGYATKTGTETLTNKTIASGTYTGTQTGFVGDITGNADTVTTNANLTGDVTSVGNATTIANTVVDTNQLVDDSVTMAKLDSPVAGGTYVLSRLMGATTVGSTNATAYVDVGLPRWYSSDQHMGFQVLINGVIRLQYEHRTATAGTNASIRVLQNGSAIFAYTEGTATWTAYAHDITVTAGDLIILQQKTAASSVNAEWRNIRVTTANRTPAVA